MRKLIQIVDCPDSASSQGCIFGLCDDGTLWAFQAGKWDIVSEGVPQSTNTNNDDLFFVGYTNPYQIVHSCDKVEPSGSFYPNTDEETTIPLFMLKCHEHRLLNLTDGDLSLQKIKELQDGVEL